MGQTKNKQVDTKKKHAKNVGRPWCFLLGWCASKTCKGRHLGALQMPKEPQLAHFKMKKLCVPVWAPHPVSKAEPRHSVEKTQFSLSCRHCHSKVMETSLEFSLWERRPQTWNCWLWFYTFNTWLQTVPAPAEANTTTSSAKRWPTPTPIHLCSECRHSAHFCYTMWSLNGPDIWNNPRPTFSSPVFPLWPVKRFAYTPPDANHESAPHLIRFTTQQWNMATGLMIRCQIWSLMFGLGWPGAQYTSDQLCQKMVFIIAKAWLAQSESSSIILVSLSWPTSVERPG